MNQSPYTYIPPIIPNNVNQQLANISKELHEINEKLNTLINKNQIYHTENDDNLYML